jgi:ribosomal peptide maturation radical SAM protein 1
MSGSKDLLSIRPLSAQSKRTEPLCVALVTMPFFDLNLPGLGITQLMSLIKSQMPELANVKIVYGNHFLAGRFGVDFHQKVCEERRETGLGDWLFRQLAFPELPDNSEEYHEQIYFYPELQSRWEYVLKLRPKLEELCTDLIDEHELDGCDVVGFSSMFTQTMPSLALARLLKELRPEIITLMGGPNCEAPMGPALVRNAPMLDYAFSGPALKSFPKFLSSLAAAEDRQIERLPRGVFAAETPLDATNQVGDELPLTRYIRADYSQFQRAFDRTQKGRNRRRSPRGKALPARAFHFIRTRLPQRELIARSVLHPVISYETSRGCWWGERSHCTFCGLNGISMAYRSMPAELALKQLDDLVADYYPWSKEFYSVDNILPEEYPNEFFPRVRLPHDVALFYEVRVKNLDRKTLHDLAQAGVRLQQPGIESIANSTLKRMGKGTTSFQNINYLIDCLDFGITAKWNLLVGFPGEDDSSYKHYLDAIPLLHHLEAPDVGPVRFDRFSPHFMKAEEFGLELRPFAYYSYTFPFPEAALVDLAYYFADVGEAEYAEVLAPYLPQLRAAIKEWQTAFHKGKAVLKGELRPDGTVRITDTRQGQRLKYVLQSDAAALLLKLRQPTRLDKLSLEDQRLLRELNERRLIFGDAGRVLSVVSWGSAFEASESTGRAPRKRSRGEPEVQLSAAAG